MAVTDPKPMSRAALVANAICLPLGLIALVCLPVGRLDWKPGWIFIALLVAAFGASALILARVNPSIYLARSRFQPGTKCWDLVLVTLILLAMITEVPLATLDAGRMRWSSMPRTFVILGYALLGTGVALSTWAQAVNPFFEPGVRVQRERGQQVISKGPYATVRHPGYASALMIFAGLALSLASWWALIPAAWASLILIVRTKWKMICSEPNSRAIANTRNVRAIGSFRVCGEQVVRRVPRHVAKGQSRPNSAFAVESALTSTSDISLHRTK
jgi:protein-S-isoprenylcysteine O-methyltransferase Ste14